MYTSTRDQDRSILDALRDDSILRHDGDYRQLVRQHQAQVRRVPEPQWPEGRRKLSPLLWKRIADSRTLRTAIACLDRRKAPGPDGLRLDELDVGGCWALARCLKAAILCSRYRPGPERKVEIPKRGKPNQIRTLTIQSSSDRVVAKAVQLILEPVLEREFLPLSFGFRPERGRVEALATASRHPKGRRSAVLDFCGYRQCLRQYSLLEINRRMQTPLPMRGR